MKIKRLKSFQNAYLKLLEKIKVRFKQRFKDFLDGNDLSVLKPHKLRGNLLGLYAFSITGDYRCIMKKKTT